MATRALPPITAGQIIPNEVITINSPWQGQGLDNWKALVRNDSPYGLTIGAGANTYWLGPYEQDYYEFGDGVYSFLMIPTSVGPVPVGGVILITAFDQSSSYDGQFPVPLTQPVLQQTFTKLASGSFEGEGPAPTFSGAMPFSFNAVMVVIEGQLSASYPVESSQPGAHPQYNINPPTSFVLRAGGPVATAGSFLRYFTLVLACSAPGPTWNLDLTSYPIELDSSEMPFSFTYVVYAVTLADVDSLLESMENFGINITEESFGCGSGLVQAGFEEPIRSSRSKRLIFEGAYSGPATLVLNTSGGLTYSNESLPTAVTTFLLVDDTSNPADNWVVFSFARDVGTCWDLALGNNAEHLHDVTINLQATISLVDA